MENFKKNQTILVVDDVSENLSIISGLLNSDYKVKVARNGEKAISIAVSLSRRYLAIEHILSPICLALPQLMYLILPF